MSIDKSFIKKALNIKWVTNLRARWIIALVAVCCTALIGLPLIGPYIVLGYQSLIIQQMVAEEIQSQPISIYTHYVTVFQEVNRIYQTPDKPYIVVSSFTAQDYRGNAPYSLRMNGYAINEGNGIAYNGVLHVVAMNYEGVAIDTNQSFGGITPHATLRFSFSLKYNGSAIINCTITPFYTDKNM